jgi:Flp pilus assembly protein TadG
MTPLRRDEGQSTVEPALVLPLLVLVVCFVVQLAVVVRDRIAVTHVARVAARAAVVDPSPDAVAAAARSASGLDASRLRISVRGGGGPGAPVTVEVRYRSSTDVPLAGRLLGDLTFVERLSARVG